MTFRLTIRIVTRCTHPRNLLMLDQEAAARDVAKLRHDANLNARPMIFLL
jgi:hypothetical protein